MDPFLLYLEQNLASDLGRLKGDRKPLWGILTPQHMVEHLVGSWRISNGRARASLAIPETELAERLAFLHSNRDFPRLLKNPIMPDGLWPLRKTDLQAAIDQLLDEIHTFGEHHQNHPGIIHVHPLFGPLAVEDWLRFQQKHMRHHFRQFGLSFPERF